MLVHEDADVQRCWLTYAVLTLAYDCSTGVL